MIKKKREKKHETINASSRKNGIITGDLIFYPNIRKYGKENK